MMELARKSNWKPLLFSVGACLTTGFLSAALSGNTKAKYQRIAQPPLSPPGVVFPIAWTVLYTLMGISAYLVGRTGAPGKKKALTVFGVQLLLNVLWSPLFFGLQLYLPAFALLVLLWAAILLMIRAFYKICPTAGLIQVPYLLWVSFAGYLNLATFFLNR